MVLVDVRSLCNGKLENRVVVEVVVEVVVQV